jgi:S-adenosyl-L-methionine hydrolase (adenosine-forming)
VSFISLMTDFGTRDGNVGVMKGVIWGIAPQAQIADLTHEISPQNIRQAAYRLSQTFYFPENSIHVVVVDPGVGTSRRPIAAQIGLQRFVGPDNGVLSAVIERAEREQWPVRFVHLNKPEYWLPKVSDVFHGRDIFSPVAAHLAAGVPLEDLGMLIDDPVRIPLPRPQRTETGIAGEVIHIDYFGNVISNIHHDHLVPLSDVKVTLNGIIIEGMVRTFGERQPGDLIALYTSIDYLMVSVVNGNAAEQIKARIGDKIEVTPRH